MGADPERRGLRRVDARDEGRVGPLDFVTSFPSLGSITSTSPGFRVEAKCARIESAKPTPLDWVPPSKLPLAVSVDPGLAAAARLAAEDVASTGVVCAHCGRGDRVRPDVGGPVETVTGVPAAPSDRLCPGARTVLSPLTPIPLVEDPWTAAARHGAAGHAVPDVDEPDMAVPDPVDPSTQVPELVLSLRPRRYGAIVIASLLAALVLLAVVAVISSV
jgi:hypothetical protein